MSEPNDPSAVSRSGCPGWVKILLAVSLAGNLAVVGLMGGVAMRGGEHGWRGDAEGLDRRQSRILRFIPESRRDEARAVMLAGRDAIGAERSRMDGVHAEILAILRANDFSADRLGAALAERREISSAINGIIHAQMLTVVSDMSSDERTEMADSLERIARRWRDRRNTDD